MATRNSVDNRRRSDCPISFGLDLFGDRWTLLILRDILFYDRTRFSDFAPREHIPTNILADRLQRLESAGVIERRQDERWKNQYRYDVTDKGRDLLPTLVAMTLWGLQYDPQTAASPEFVRRIESERPKVAKEVLRSIQRGTFVRYRQEQMGIGG